MTKYRKSNRAKQVSNSCRNNGSCLYCLGNRMHSTNKRIPAVMTLEELDALPEPEANSDEEQ